MIQKYSFIFDGNTSCVIFSFFPIVSIFLLSPTSFHFSQFLSIFYGRITISHKYKLHAVRWTQYFFRVSILPQFQYYLTQKNVEFGIEVWLYIIIKYTFIFFAFYYFAIKIMVNSIIWQKRNMDIWYKIKRAT